MIEIRVFLWEDNFTRCFIYLPEERKLIEKTNNDILDALDKVTLSEETFLEAFKDCEIIYNEERNK